MHGHQQPLTLPWLKGRGDGLEIGMAVSWRRLEHPHAWIASAQRAADLFLIRVRRLNGVPAGRPDKRNQRPRRVVRSAFHRERKRRVRIIRWLGLRNVDV